MNFCLKSLRILSSQVVRSFSTTPYQSQFAINKLLSCPFNYGARGVPMVSPLLQTASDKWTVNTILPKLLTPFSLTGSHQVRCVTKYSLRSGKRKTVKAVTRRFLRLHWGIWIRTKTGRHKKIWKKSSNQRRRLRQHVFCNATQSHLLDKMVTRFWREPRYYVNDPYAPYHSREEFPLTRKKPVGS